MNFVSIAVYAAERYCGVMRLLLSPDDVLAGKSTAA